MQVLRHEITQSRVATRPSGVLERASKTDPNATSMHRDLALGRSGGPGQSSEDAVEDGAEVVDEVVFDLRDGDFAAGQGLREVTPRSEMPQGTISLKKSRSVFTLNANPWLVTQRWIRTPMAPIFSAPTHAPVSPAIRPAVKP